ncbi:EI24 domain-containing protein [Salmonella enterica subsp. enterica]|nr:EI24 domain-containing protein [Salmonella enterica subsp. enterica]
MAVATTLDTFVDESCVPDWLQWLNLSAVADCGYLCSAGLWLFFSTLANCWIAAPFNGLLAEQRGAVNRRNAARYRHTRHRRRCAAHYEEREWQKLAVVSAARYRAAGSPILFGIGQTIAPVLWFLFSARMLAISIATAFDNHKGCRFKTMRAALRTQKVANMQFGASPASLR